MLDSLLPLGLVKTEDVRGRIRYSLTEVGGEVALVYQGEALGDLFGRRRART